MEFLKSQVSLVALLFLASCTPSNTQTVVTDLEVDSYISSSDLNEHAESKELYVSLDSALEERALLKLPTDDKSGSSKDIEDGIEDIVKVLFFPFYLVESIIASLVECPEPIVKPENLVSSKLTLDVLDSAAGLDGKVELDFLAKPWWHNATWEYSHFFSTAGRWSTGGGDIDSARTAIPAVVSGNTLTFDITDYFKEMLTSASPVHYGFVLKATQNLSRVRLASVQSSSSVLVPRLVSTYTGNCTGTSSLLKTTVHGLAR